MSSWEFQGEQGGVLCKDKRKLVKIMSQLQAGELDGEGGVYCLRIKLVPPTFYLYGLVPYVGSQVFGEC